MEFLLTGSRIYGPVSPDSDLDIVIMYDDAPTLHAYLTEHGIETYNTPTQDSYGDTGGFYFKLAGIEINIIVAGDRVEFNWWAERTYFMKTIPPIENRDERLAVFREEINIKEVI